MTGAFGGCGIAGIVRFRDAAAAGSQVGDAAAVRRMMQALSHRGPHGQGLWQRPGITLGHRRLSLLDLGEGGAQPMTREHLTVVHNGELYNHAHLRERLRRRFTSGTDTEVLLRAWQAWGPAALDRLAGMYAFAVWDEHARLLHLVRDRIGIKPLYYHHNGGYLAFASEVEALLHGPPVPRRPNLTALCHQLLHSSTLETDRTRTLVDGIAAVAPATWLRVQPDSRIRTRTYWQLPPTTQPPTTPAVRSRRDLGEELGHLLRDTVDTMLVADVPVAVFLSGGLDSSTLTALAARQPAAPTGRPQPIQPRTAVTIAYTSPGRDASLKMDNPDLRYSRLLAQHLGERIDHHVHLQPTDVTLQDIDSVIDLAALGEDPRHVTILANYRAVHDLGMRAVLNGQGADEIMGGYVGLPAFRASILDVRHPDLSTITALPGSRQATHLSGDVLARCVEAHERVLTYHQALPGTPLERAHRLLFATQLARVVQFEDFLSMRVGVESRLPYLDHHIVQWCFAIPFDMHINPRHRQGKQLLRLAARPWLPPAVHRRPKAVFPAPDQTRLHHSLSRIASTHETDLRADPLIGHLFTLPPSGRLAELPARTLWLLLSLWRWHHTLQHIPNPYH